MLTRTDASLESTNDTTWGALEALHVIHAEVCERDCGCPHCDPAGY